MSKSIDNRVVQMGFENKQFESGVATSTKSLDTLKQALKFDKAAEGLKNLSNIGRGFTLQSMSDSIDAISNRFSTLGIMGITVIQNLTNAAINMTKKIADTLLIAPLRTGLQEYETQLNAIQTVLANTASKGTTLEDVNAALNELNTYSDKTIYNFTQMAKNIGTFTAAGVSLEDSTAAIKGIANLAAVSGSNSEQASTAMYQLSQAMASGTVKLMDWNSVVNAGMGGQVFQDALKETARNHKINIDGMIKTEGSFRETLQRGWLTTNILTETLSKFTGDLAEDQIAELGYTGDQIDAIIKLGNTANDAATKVKTFTQLQQTLQESIQSGWTKSWQLIIGDFEEAKTFWTDISNIFGTLIGNSSDARNSLLQGWKDLGGRSILIDTIKMAITTATMAVQQFSEAFTEIFPPATAKDLYNITGAIWLFVKGIRDGLRDSDAFKRTIKGVAAALDIIRMAVMSVIGLFFDLSSSMVPSIGNILDFTAKIGDFIVALRETIIANGTFTNGIQKVKDFLDRAKETFASFSARALEIYTFVREKLSKMFENLDLSGLGGFVGKVQVRFSPLTKLVQGVSAVFSRLWDVVVKVSPLFAKIGELMVKAISGFTNSLLDGLNNLDFNNTFDTLNGGLMAALILTIKNFVSKGSGVFEGITGILGGVQGSLQAWQDSLKAETLLKLAMAIGIIAISLIAISLVDSEKLTAALVSVTIMFGQLVAALQILDKVSIGPKLVGAIAAIMLLSVSLLILTAAVKVLSEIDAVKLTNGLFAVGVILGEIAIFLKVSNLDGAGVFKGVGLLFLANSLLILAFAVEKFGKIDPEKLKQGLLGIGAILTEITIFNKVSGGMKSLALTAAGLILVAASMLIFAFAIEQMGKLDGEVIGKGLATMGATLLVVGIAIRALPMTMLATAGALVVVAVSLVILSKALLSFGSMSWDEIARGMGALAGMLAILTITLNSLSLSAVPGAVAMIIMAGAIAILTPALMSLGSMEPQEIGLALLALAGAFAVLGLAGVLLGPLLPVLLGLSGAMLLFGLGITAVGIGVLAFSVALASLAVSGAAGAAAIVLIVNSLVTLLPTIATRLAEAIVDFAMVIREGAPIIGQAITAVMLALIAAIVAVVPELIVAAILLITTLLTTLAANFPKIVQAGFDLLMALLNGIKNNITRVVTTAYDIIVRFIRAIAAKIPDIVRAGIELIVAFIDGLTIGVEEGMPRILASFDKLGKAIVEGLVQGLKDNAFQVINAIIEMGKNALGALMGTIDSHSPSREFAKIGKTIPEGSAVGVDDNAYLLYNSIKDLGKESVSIMADSISKITDAMNMNVELTPTIRPVIDMSEVISGGNEINKLLSGKTMTIVATPNKASLVSSNLGSTQNGSEEINKPVAGSSVIFNQNNYSPVALSRLEIYRQTKNQLLTLKGLVVN